MSYIIEGPYTQLTPPVQRGFGSSFCRRQTGRWSPTSGWTFDQDFNGLDYNLMQGLANQFAGVGIEYELTLENGIAKMTTRDTTGNITIDIWETQASRVTESWLKNPLLLNLLYQVAAAYTGSGNQAVLDWNVTRFVGKLAAGIQNNESPFDLTKPASIADASGVFSSSNFFDGTATFAIVSPAVYLPIFRAYQRAQTGQDAFFSDTYTLRHTTSASNRGYTNVADTNVNCIYTPSQFFSEITDSGYWIFPCPNEILGDLNTIFNQLIASNGTGGAEYLTANYITGALKGGSPRVTTANNRVNIVTEYQLANISADEYLLAT